MGLAARLKETKGMRIFKRGFERAAETLEKGEENFEGVFIWAPRVKDWLKDLGLYILAVESETKGEKYFLHFIFLLRASI